MTLAGSHGLLPSWQESSLWRDLTIANNSNWIHVLRQNDFAGTRIALARLH